MMKRFKRIVALVIAFAIIATSFNMVYAEEASGDSSAAKVSADASDDAVSSDAYKATSEVKTEVTTEVMTTEVSTTEDVNTDISSAEASTDASADAPFSEASKVDSIYLTAHGKTKVVVSWTSVYQATGYLVYKKAPSASYKLVSFVYECKYTDSSVKYGKTYEYKIVPVMDTNASMEASADASRDASYYVSGDGIIKGLENSITFKNAKIVATGHQKYTYTEMKGDIALLCKNYHGIVKSHVFGKSEDNRNLYDVTVGNPNAKKSLMVVASIHAREYMTTVVTMSQIEYYLQNYYSKIDGKSVSGTLDNICIHFVPMANPDGVTISQSGFNSIRNKTLRAKLKKMPGYSRQWKSNARGVDLNRNYAYKFRRRGIRGQEGYSGAKASSEKETKAISKLITSLKSKGLKGAVNYHTMGSIIFGGIKKSAAAYKNTKRMYKVAKNTTKYLASEAVGYGSSGYGNLREYFMYTKKVPSITIEVGRYCNPVPQSQFKGIWSKNKKLVLREARLFD